MAIYLERGAPWCGMFAHGQANATAIPKPHHFLPNLNPDWFTFRPTQVVLEKRLLNGCSSSSSKGGSVADWLACWTQAQKGPGSNCSRDAIG